MWHPNYGSSVENPSIGNCTFSLRCGLNLFSCRPGEAIHILATPTTRKDRIERVRDPADPDALLFRKWVPKSIIWSWSHDSSIKSDLSRTFGVSNLSTVQAMGPSYAPLIWHPCLPSIYHIPIGAHTSNPS